MSNEIEALTTEELLIRYRRIVTGRGTKFHDSLIELESCLQEARQRDVARAALKRRADDLEEEAKDLFEQARQMQQWIEDLQSGMYINCVYCGHRYGPSETTPVSMADALKAHIEQCPKHPMSALKAEVERLRSTPAHEPVPTGNYKTRHGDGLIIYDAATNQLSVSKLQRRMRVFVGTLPDGWGLYRLVLRQET